MSFNLQSITTGAQVRPPRIVLLGTEKAGKSTFASGFPDPIFIPLKLEEGIDALDVAKFPVCSTLDGFMEALGTLADEDHNFKTLVIDSASALEPIIWQSLCEEYNVKSIELVASGYGKGFSFALDRWRTIMLALDYLRDEKGMTVILIGHTKIKKFDDPERNSYDQWVFDIQDKAAQALYRWADLIAFANVNVGTTTESSGFNKKTTKAEDLDPGTRYLFTQKSPARPGGGRGVYGQLPSEIPLNWAAFQTEVDSLLKPAKKSLKK